MAFGRIFKELASNMVQAFTSRAKEVYSVAKIVLKWYALPEKQYLQRVTLEEGATVEQAIRASGSWSFAAISIWRRTKSVFTAVR
jgi:hypothetical protein